MQHGLESLTRWGKILFLRTLFVVLLFATGLQASPKTRFWVKIQVGTNEPADLVLGRLTVISEDEVTLQVPPAKKAWTFEQGEWLSGGSRDLRALNQTSAVSIALARPLNRNLFRLSTATSGSVWRIERDSLSQTRPEFAGMGNILLTLNRTAGKLEVTQATGEFTESFSDHRFHQISVKTRPVSLLNGITLQSFGPEKAHNLGLAIGEPHFRAVQAPGFNGLPGMRTPVGIQAISAGPGLSYAWLLPETDVARRMNSAPKLILVALVPNFLLLHPSTGEQFDAWMDTPFDQHDLTTFRQSGIRIRSKANESTVKIYSLWIAAGSVNSTPVATIIKNYFAALEPNDKAAFPLAKWEAQNFGETVHSIPGELRLWNWCAQKVSGAARRLGLSE